MARGAGRPGTLLVIATPLGNLEDVTPRAAAALGRAALVACEDTRRTRGLLEHLGIRPPRIISSHRFNERGRIETILEALRRGEDVALVSDGGTPGVSDPGAPAVEAALKEGLPVSPVPGPSAVAAAMSVSGFDTPSFLFAGFLPPRSGPRRRAIERLAAETRPVVIFEAPHRVAAAVADLLAGMGDRQVTLTREITKMHEEVRRTTLSALAAVLAASQPRGEFTLVIEGGPARRAAPAEPPAPSGIRERYDELIARGIDRREALRMLVKETGLPRRAVYAAVVREPRTG